MGKELQKVEQIVYCCMGSKCKKRSREKLSSVFKDHLKSEKLKDKVLIIKTLCTGHCDDGPIVHLQPTNCWYRKVDKKTVEQIVKEHIKHGTVVEEKLLFNNDKYVG